MNLGLGVAVVLCHAEIYKGKGITSVLQDLTRNRKAYQHASPREVTGYSPPSVFSVETAGNSYDTFREGLANGQRADLP